MKDITLFPIRKTATGLTCTVRTSDSLEEKLVFVDDAYTAHKLGLALPKGKKTWVECRTEDENAKFSTFKADNNYAVEAPAGHHFDVVPWPDRETGQPWTTKDGDVFHGVVLLRD